MLSNSVDNRLLAVAAKILDVDVSKLSLDAGVGDLPQWDSFAHVGLVAEIEATFEIAFDIEEMTSFVTLGDIAEVVRNKAEASGTATAA